MSNKSNYDLGIDVSEIKNHAQYRECWKKLGRLEIKMIEKHEECKHSLGDTFVYETPYARPVGVCPALLHVLDLYTWRAVFGFPSWNPDDRRVHKLHCPDPQGTVWELRKIED